MQSRLNMYNIHKRFSVPAALAQGDFKIIEGETCMRASAKTARTKDR